jgi:hypothetical protein
MNQKQQTVNINIRFPPEVVEVMKRLAREDTRSLNGEVIWALRAFIVQRQAEWKGVSDADQDRPGSSNT